MEFTTIAHAKKQTGLSYLGSVNASAKLAKNGKVSQQLTYGLYLAPAELSGYNVCSHSTPECRLGCLNTSGRAGINFFSGVTIINDCRVKKTKLLFENQDLFMNWLISDIKLAQLGAIRKGFFFSVRLNCTSDIDWGTVLHNGLNIFQIFPDVDFYDYTKNPNKFVNKPDNYHLTLSFTGRNWTSCEVLLKRGHNVAIVFNVKTEAEMPIKFDDFNVIYGDATDWRTGDGKGVIVGLKWKRIANRMNERKVLNSVFVVQPNDVRCNANVQVFELEFA